MENARRKAYTAMTFKQPTAEYAKKFLDGNPVTHQQITLPNVIAIPGGEPSEEVGNDVIGGIGVPARPALTTIASMPPRQGQGPAQLSRAFDSRAPDST